MWVKVTSCVTDVACISCVTCPGGDGGSVGGGVGAVGGGPVGVGVGDGDGEVEFVWLCWWRRPEICAASSSQNEPPSAD